MTGRPATLQLTFAGLLRQQLQAGWVAQGGGLESYVFEGSDLVAEEQWVILTENLRHARSIGASKLTMHFPTEGADWVNDTIAFDRLLRFCDLAAEVSASGVTLHANQFVQQRDWCDYDLRAGRSRTLDRLAELDARLDGWPLWLGVENMPVIGAQGIDYDSIFVYPDDFAGLAEIDSERIGVTWDVCHWAVTFSMVASIAQLRQEPELYAPLALPPVPIRHIHFGSFSGRAMPFWPHECTEGVTPQRGDFDTDLLASMLRVAIEAAGSDVGVVLEVQEPDYVDRKNCWQTLSWLRGRPELDALHSMNEGP